MRVNSASVHNGIIRIDNQIATEAELQAITHVSQSMSICFNADLPYIHLPNLMTVGNSMSFLSNQRLVTIRLPMLSTVAWLSLADTSSLVSVSAPKLEQISHGLYISNMPYFHTLNVPNESFSQSNVTLSESPLLSHLIH